MVEYCGTLRIANNGAVWKTHGEVHVKVFEGPWQICHEHRTGQLNGGLR